MLLVDKPAGATSHDIVAIVRRAARTRRVGHAGTLDPFATGLLVLAVGPATRLLSHIVGEPKVYEATFTFGSETDTDDSTGQVIREAEVPPSGVLSEQANPLRLSVELQLTGKVSQVPPGYSAKHVNGRRAYELARSGESIEMSPVEVNVHKWEWCAGTDTELCVRISVGSGTYIRALARDMGRLLGSAAHCSTLRRIQSGPALVADAIRADELTPGSLADGTIPLVPPASFLTLHEQVTIDIDDLQAVVQGRAIKAGSMGTRAALLSDGVLVALAERDGAGRWQPRVVLSQGAST